MYTTFFIYINIRVYICLCVCVSILGLKGFSKMVLKYRRAEKDTVIIITLHNSNPV